MGRGKNNRRRASIDGPVADHHCFNQFNPSSNTNNAMMPISLNSSPTSYEEIVDVIEYHWKNLSLDLKQFLLKNPEELCLRRFVNYWTAPSRRENTSPNIAASICGCSWYLALNYMTIGKIVEARALILNGCFLQQCYNKPIEEIVAVARSKSCSCQSFRSSLPLFADGLLAISNEESMSRFLRHKVSNDYRRRMSFATRTTQTKQKVQDYVDQISSDWNDGCATNSAAVKRQKQNEARRRRRRATLQLCDGASSLPEGTFMEIRLVDDATGDETKVRHGLDLPLKLLFKKYADDRNSSLRQLRFSYEGRTLFLSSAGQKTPQDLGMKDLDSVRVFDNLAASSRKGQEEEGGSSTSSSDESKSSAKSDNGRKGRKKNRNRAPCRRASWAGPEILGEKERLKLEHSRRLSRVFGEAAPRFERIRRRLNTLNLECTPPKVKRPRKRIPATAEPPPLNNPNADGIGGKAGVPFYAVHVGAAENLYNTGSSKTKARTPAGPRNKAISIDLHGRTREEALSDLDAGLPGWMDVAMRGSHPFTVRVVIVCGGGDQVLSEAVEGWIRGNENVAKAPRERFSRRRSV